MQYFTEIRGLHIVRNIGVIAKKMSLEIKRNNDKKNVFYCF